jgi:hypothetical protein
MAMKKIPAWVIMLVVALILGFLVYRTSGYTGSPITTDQGDSLPASVTSGNPSTSISCIPDAYYSAMDGTGYGVCGIQEDIKHSMSYAITGAASDNKLGD